MYMNMYMAMKTDMDTDTDMDVGMDLAVGMDKDMDMNKFQEMADWEDFCRSFPDKMFAKHQQNSIKTDHTAIHLREAKKFEILHMECSKISRNVRETCIIGIPRK